MIGVGRSRIQDQVAVAVAVGGNGAVAVAVAGHSWGQKKRIGPKNFNARSRGALGRSWRSFCFIFSFFFLHRCFIDLFVILNGGLGGIWDAKTVEKSIFWAVFGNMLFETLILVEFCLIFGKPMAHNTLNYCCFSCCFLCFFERSKP